MAANYGRFYSKYDQNVAFLGAGVASNIGLNYRVKTQFFIASATFLISFFIRIQTSCYWVVKTEGFEPSSSINRAAF
jgi:hypothetical protein